MIEPEEQPDPVRIDFHLLDRQIIDPAGAKVGKVDDIELEQDENGRITVAALLVGQVALGGRIGGVVGRWLGAVARRLRSEEDPAPLRIAYRHVMRFNSEVIIGIRRELLDTPPLERWLRDRFIARIPGAGRASK